MFEGFIRKVKNRYETLKEWRDTHPNDKIFATLCTYVPEEILYAANILPSRILSFPEPTIIVDAHIQSMYCLFCRSCLSQLKKEDYEFIEGIVYSQSCLHMRQAFWIAQDKVDSNFFAHYLAFPHGTGQPSENAVSFYAYELLKFKEKLEKWLNRKITNEDLRRGISIVNENRRLLREIYELRKRRDPPLTGAEALAVVMCSQMFDKREINQQLAEILPKLRERKLGRGDTIRLMWVGSELDDLDLVEMVERLNATFVIDESCTGSRYFWNPIENLGSDPLLSISSRYINRIPCPAKDWPDRRRIPFILQLAKEWNVQAAILLQQKFCDPHEFDLPIIAMNLRDKLNIPSYYVEIGNINALGQLKVRIEAFLESLTMEVL